MAINRLATVRGGGESSFGNRLLFPDGGPTADLELFCSGAEVFGGKGEALQPTVFSFLVFDVDRHVAVDLGKGARNPVQYSTSWPTPTATNRHAGPSGHAVHQKPITAGTLFSASALRIHARF